MKKYARIAHIWMGRPMKVDVVWSIRDFFEANTNKVRLIEWRQRATSSGLVFNPPMQEELGS